MVKVYDKNNQCIEVKADEATELIRHGLVHVHDDPSEDGDMITLFVCDLDKNPTTLEDAENWLEDKAKDSEEPPACDECGNVIPPETNQTRRGWQALNEADMALVVMVLEELGNHADMSIIDDAAIKAGILWQCACGWFNPANKEHCQSGDDCPFTRDLSVVSDE